MRLAIITFHRALNYGALLQAYALYSTLRDMGIDVEVLDYRAPYIEFTHNPIALKKMIHVRSYLKNLLNNNISFTSRGVFNRFIRCELKVSKKYTSKSIYESNKEYDTFLVGSDQVWNPYCNGSDNHYLLDFVKKGKTKLSFSSSVGLDAVNDVIGNTYAKYLTQFASISVREPQSSKILQKYIQKNVRVTVDPTLLLSSDAWTNLANKSSLRMSKYILIYNIVEDDKIFEHALSVSSEMNLPIYYINDRMFSKRGMRNLRNVSIYDFLYLFANAEYVITNSFHGLLFSVIFSKKFSIAYLPGGAKVNSRIRDYLESFKLESRLIRDGNVIDILNIDYSKTRPIVTDHITNSLDYLEKIMEAEYE